MQRRHLLKGSALLFATSALQAGGSAVNPLGALQELNYPAIAKAIKDSGFSGYLAQEFIPTPTTEQGPVQSLRDAIALCEA